MHALALNESNFTEMIIKKNPKRLYNNRQQHKKTEQYGRICTTTAATQKRTYYADEECSVCDAKSIL